MEKTTIINDVDEKTADALSSLGETIESTIYIDPEKEKAVLRKFDKWLLPQAFVFILLNYLDRSNLGNARVFGFEKSLGMTKNEFGNLVTLFFVPYIILEVFWVTTVKRFGANYVITGALFGWCSVTIATGFVQNFHQALACRMILGAFEAGVAPAFGFIFSTIYAREPTAKRIALINLANVTSGAFGGMFAWAIQSMGMGRGLEAWRWLFIIEGSNSLAICGGCLFSFLNKPETACVAFFTSSVAIFGFGTFLPTLIKGLGYLTIPVYAVGALSLAAQAYWSDRLKQRALFLLISAVPVTIAYCICIGTPNKIPGYVAMFILVTGVYSVSCLMITWVATNLTPDYKRSVGLPVFCSIGNCSGLVAGQLYPAEQGPRYIMGNGISAGLEVVAAVFVIPTWLLLRRRNQQKAKLIAEGATTNGLEGDEALDFKYIL
ncbi:high-affinity nicotinic acid transporter [Tothia fuscella]|uniref:High-affinity nicotinic acid transporter n=1 Tax=Tothia fuscella TaxID=1048955 RepID=A0A9P4TZW0_9PEZI|nr:high-affinity nicotinic acid transporter [Tothia fuscella]